MGHRFIFGKKLFMFSAAAILLCGMLSPQFVLAGDKKIGEQCAVTADCVQGAGCQDNICIADSFGTVDVGGSAGLAGGDIRTTIGRIIQIILGLLGVIAVGIVLFGGFMYMTAGGSDDKVVTAKKIITNGVIGLAIILASFAIVRFIFSSLSNATGSGSLDNTQGQIAECKDPSGVCVIPPATGGEKCIDTNNFFIAESISPNQKKATGMNNIVIRAVFSKSVATAPDKIFEITEGGSVVAANLFSYAFVPNTNNRIVEATYISPDGICKGTEKNCLPLSGYKVKLLPGIKDVSGTLLQNEEAGQKCDASFANIVTNGAAFTVDIQANDPEKPKIEAGLLVNGQLTSDPDIKIPVGKQYTAMVTTTDNSGIAYLHVELFSSGQEEKVIDEWYAPVNNTDAAFSKKITFNLANSVKINTSYILKFTVQDIDHQVQSLGLVFTAVGPTCGNGVQDGDETGVDTGGSCGGGPGKSCQSDIDCSNGYQCIKNSCTARPYIVSVSPMDGASGNWVTIYGKNFGDQAGTVEFGVTDGDNKPFAVKNDKWYPAKVVMCQNTVQKWSDKQIIVEIPEDSDLFTTGSKSAIKVKAKNGTEDTTINNVGFIPAPDGRFVKNTTKRPGLCEVVTHEPPIVSYGKPKVGVHALGKGFGDKKDIVWFGDIKASIVQSGLSAHWGDTNVEAIVPNLAPGPAPVQVEVNKEKSNPFYFDVLAEAAQITGPIISQIDPATTTIKSLITISGTGFGEGTSADSKVFFNSKPSSDCSGDDCKTGIVNLAQQCGDTWKNNQVIVQVPDTLEAGKTYYIVVQNDAKLKTDGKISIGIETGSPLPGICGLSPSSGPSPLPPEHAGITLVGSNFTNKPLVYFYKKGESFTDVSKWYLTDAGAVVNLIKKVSDTEIVTMLPFKDGGFMATGPIKVSANNQFSNSVAYTVDDCSVAGSKAPGPGYQCCTANGPDKGLWKKDDQICKGDTRLAGYVWRFTTGIFPDIPQVVEQCKDKIPASPSPWISQGEGANACLDSVIRVQFTTAMDKGTFTDANIKVFSCKEIKDDECVEKQPVKIVFTKKESTYFEATPEAGKFAENTWYHVELSNAITAFKEQTVAGQKKIFKQPLIATSPCGTGTAYCFDFKSGAGLCEVKEIGVIPPKHTTGDLGIVQDPAFLFDNNVNNPQHPLVYSTWAQATQACTMLDTTKMEGWNWKIDPSVAEAAAAAKVIQSLKNPSTATAEALNHYPTGASIIAGVPSKGKELTGASTLIIDLLEPKVTAFEPNCSESCINPQIRVQFNREMDPTTYQNGFFLWKCLDGANCGDLQKVSVNIDIASTKKELIIPVSLTKNSYYKAVVKGIKSIAGYNKGVPIQGAVVNEFYWTFKTQNSDAACAIGNVLITPDPFTAKAIGEKAQYSATPFSGPNNCSKYGQALNKWAYTYKWETLDPQVATITNFPNIAVGDVNASCSIACLPKGSDITVDNKNPEDIALCGNGTVDPGEDCDIGVLGETASVSCSLSCLRPGNKNKNIGDNAENTCGNGKVEPGAGEFCDPKDNAGFCSEDCRPLGSGSFDASKVGASVCGDGQVTKGETCDIGINDKTTLGKINCTEQCLHTGTKTATFWCDKNKLFASKDECISSISECGNAGKLESDEECEFAGKETKIRVGGVEKIVPVDPNVLCSKNCRLQNACDLTAIQVKESEQLGGLWCEKGTEGCANDCRLAGSSPMYSTPSLCGDGNPGIGEYAYCEAQKAPGAAGSSPIQVATAKGEKIPAADKQETTVKVTLSTSATSFTATSTFALQCGYTEFAAPKIINNKVAFNDCPNGDQGVSGTSSCCLPRPVRVTGSEYPLNGAGFNGTAAACPNTAIFATFTKEIKEDSLHAENIRIARGFTAENVNCTTVGSGSINVTDHVAKTIAYGSLNEAGFFKKLWTKIAHFFTNIFKTNVFAESIKDTLSKYKTWCTVDASLTSSAITIPAIGQTATTTKVMITIDKPLAPEAVHVVLLKGGANGIIDTSGVGIRNPNNNTTLHDLWVFTTKKELCKIETVSVTPDNYTFTSPKVEQEFLAVGKTKDGQFIVSTPAYKWAWEWDPGENPVFNIPKLGTPTSTPQIIIAPKGTQGKLTAVASARILEDISQNGSQKGNIFSGTSNLTASFCENPWTGYTDSMFNMNFGYCPDAGKTGNTLDDLPYVKLVDVTNEVAVTISQCTVGGTGENKKICTTSADCASERLYNLPFDDGNKDQCNTFDAAVLTANGCSVVNLTQHKGICLVNDGSISYPPNYGETYRKCNADAECKFIPSLGKNEKCFDPGGDTWRVKNNACVATPTPAKKALSTSQDTLKKLLFVSDKSDDVIGLQIFKNEKKDGKLKTAQEWFSDKFIGVGNTQPLTIAGYDAVSDGSNYYINALNIDKKTNEVFSNIYLFSTNPDASADMKAVLQKILTSLTFNINLSDYGYCRKTNSTSYADISSISCQNDFDCADALGTPLAGTSGECSNEKTRFLRDWKRLNHIKVAQETLEKYKSEKKTYPDLKSGTFIPSYSVSKWSSWSQALGIPSDPINTWSQCAGPDQETCWNSTAGTFTCPKLTSVYEYSFVSSTKLYSLHVPFEYFDYTDPAVKKQLAQEFIKYPDLISSAPKCQPSQVYSAFGGSCGDGMVQPGEECDPAGKKWVTNSAFGGLNNACLSGESRELTCGATCKWKETKACSVGGFCGNGKIEAWEICDDGDGQNGKYGFCHTDCKGPSPAGYCGNSIIDKDASGKALEACDLGPSGGYNIDKTKSCSAACTIPGQYCGDGEKQTGEDCDDGNNVNNDECSATCKIEYGTLCLKEKPQFIVHNLTATTSLIFASKVDLITINNRTKGYLPNNLLNYSKNYYPTVSPISACQNAPVTAKEICEAAGLTCNGFYLLSTPGGLYKNSNCSLKMDVLLDKPEDPVWVECAGEYKPTYGNLVTSANPLCGNGQKEGEEICDEGANNGLLCSPQYGKSCTYCAADCKKILTVDPLAFCGNGKLDVGEACDFEGTESNQTSVFVATSTIIGTDANGKAIYGKGVAEQCSDKGGYKCTAKCTYLENNCVNCSVAKNKPVPKLAIITPMTSGDRSPYSNQEYVELTRPSKNNLWLGYRKINYKAALTESIYYDYKNAQYLSPLTPHYLIVNAQSVPILDQGLETSPLCKDEYKVFFNPKFAGGKGSYFPYPVNGEAPIISNEIIMSPVVPQDTFRVVVRWTNAEAEKNVSFYGAVYAVNNASGHKLYSYEDTIPLNMTWPNVFHAIVQDGAGYWVPSAVDQEGQTPYNGGIYIHDVIHGEKTYVQSYTIDMNKMINSANPLGFVVHTDGGPIYPYRENANIHVEVYKYREGQNPLYSIYEPDMVFSINKAAMTTSNKSAKYWQPFNIVKKDGKFIIDAPVRIEPKKDAAGNIITAQDGTVTMVEKQYPNGVINTGTCDVAKSIPTAVIPTACNK